MLNYIMQDTDYDISCSFFYIRNTRNDLQLTDISEELPSQGPLSSSPISLFSFHALRFDFLYIVMYEQGGDIIQKIILNLIQW